MSAEEKNIQAQEKWGEAVATGNLDDFDDVIARDLVDHDPGPNQGPGREGLKDFFRGMRQAFPDLGNEVVEIMATGDKVALRYKLFGTHEGAFMGIAPTGRRFEVAAMQIARFEDGKAVERWGLTDQLGLLQQIGAVEEMG